MPKQIIIAEQHRIAAVFAEDRVEEIVVAKGTHQVGDIFVGTIENVLPSIDAAFVNLGSTEKNGFIHISDLGPLRTKRNSTNITELLMPQQKVLVQVMKEPTGNKGPRLTGNISLPGRYVVLLPFGMGVNLSRRILKENERNRLRALGILIKPPGMGLLIRTEAEGVGEDLIIEDLDNLQRQWESIQQDYQNAKTPRLLDREQDFVTRVLRDLYSADVNRIVVDTADGLRRVKQQLQTWGDGKIPPSLAIDLHQESSSIMEYYRINAAIREALRPRVDLPSGGYIIIEPTEALTVIDVNSGSFTTSKTSRETVLWTNFEASTEIARQLRLRNIAGVIIVDFIDMESREDQLKLLEHFHRSLYADKARPQIAQLTELGLVELTRKRQGQSLYEMFGQPCPHCSGLGILAHLPGSEQEEVPLVPLQQRSSLESSDPFPDERERQLVGGTDRNIMFHPDYQERLPRRRRAKREEARPEVSERRIPALKVVAAEEGEPEVPTVVEKAPAAKPRVKPEPPEPAEVVTVTMTPQQQQVYSFMGISPLVLVNREGKENKNMIVRIALPGEEQTPSLVKLEEKEAKVEAVPSKPKAEDNGVPKIEIVAIKPKEETKEGGEENLLPVSPPASRRRRSSSTQPPE
ncbi:MAG: Rne/Rng family ribonuclease [Pseudanabaenaceae cyanobacterium SKYGB_i_bin29]|nr:Rne/Rng family ribonuclease [Pseudanabaenaceae cyanobacterium SKYG29]MDW8420541.1 Rne/Rng family ribonuclease [Pseudanabaenaceae cyanobacterium SKYGB_i_bin29]